VHTLLLDHKACDTHGSVSGHLDGTEAAPFEALLPQLRRTVSGWIIPYVESNISCLHCARTMRRRSLTKNTAKQEHVERLSVLWREIFLRCRI